MKIYDLKRNIELTKKRGFDRIVCDLEDLDNVIQEVETLKKLKLKKDIITFVKCTYGDNKKLIKFRLKLMGIDYDG